jgi:hypothetical protein
MSTLHKLRKASNLWALKPWRGARSGEIWPSFVGSMVDVASAKCATPGPGTASVSCFQDRLQAYFSAADVPATSDATPNFISPPYFPWLERRSNRRPDRRLDRSIGGQADKLGAAGAASRVTR